MNHGNLSQDVPIETRNPTKVFQLPNGLQVWLRQHQRPEGKVFLCLQLNCGSLHEEDRDWGASHFLEHMAFRGTRHFPEDAWVTFLESLGLKLGTHQNAFTGLDQTNYFFSLGNNHPDILDKALLGLADIASRMTLDPEIIEKEKAVILEEYRHQQTPTTALHQQKLCAHFPNERFSQRDPLGTPETIAKFDHVRLKSFYQSHYRPDQALLMVVGDFCPEAFIQRVTHHFETWSKPTHAPPQTPIPKPKGAGFHTFSDTTADAARIEICHFGPYYPITTVNNFERNLRRDIAFLILDRRLKRALSLQKIAAIETRSHCASILNVGVLSKVSAFGEVKHAASIIAALYEEIFRIDQHGFLGEELHQMVQMIWEDSQERIETSPSRNSSQILWKMKQAGRDRALPLEPEARAQLLERILPKITPPDLFEAFQHQVQPSREKLFIITNQMHQFPIQFQKQMRSFLMRESTIEVDPPQKPLEVPTLSLAPSVISAPSAAWSLPDLGIHGVQLANGIYFHCKHNNYHPKKFYLRIVLPGGIIQETLNQRGLSQAAVNGLNSPATQTHKAEAFRTLILEKNLTLDAGCSEDAWFMTLSGQTKAAPFALLLAQSILKDPFLSPKVFQTWKTQKKIKAQRASFSIADQIDSQFWHLVTGGDHRFLHLTPDVLNSLTFSECESWLRKMCSQAPLSFALVGDLEVQESMALAQKYFHHLSFTCSPSQPPTFPSKLPKLTGPALREITIKTNEEKAGVRFGWRSVPWLNVSHRRHLSLAEVIFSRKLRNYIRGELGLTYHISCRSLMSKAYPEGSFFVCEFFTDPNKVHNAAKLAKRAILEGLEKGISQDEFDQAKHQILERIREATQYPQYWVHWLSEFHYRNTRFDTLRNVADFFQNCSSEDVFATLRSVIQESRFFQVILYPQAT